MKEKPISKYHISINVVMMLWTIIIVLPFLLLFLSSITDETALVANGYSFFPKKYSLSSYTYIIKSGGVILRDYGVSNVVTLVGTLLNVLLTALMAYPLSIKNLPGRKFMMFFDFFTMLFNGGIVPSYIMWTGTFHVKDTIFALLLPNFLLSAWNVMMIRTYFTSSIPDGLYEAAEIDGANKIQTLFKVTIPMMMPSITICMFLSITNGFKLFDQNLSLTAGEPSKMSEMMALNIFNTFYGRTGWEGVGQAKAVIFFAIVVVIGMIQLRATRSKEVQQ